LQHVARRQAAERRRRERTNINPTRRRDRSAPEEVAEPVGSSSGHAPERRKKRGDAEAEEAPGRAARRAVRRSAEWDAASVDGSTASPDCHDVQCMMFCVKIGNKKMLP
jgi:hypothetical protein